MQQLQYAVAKQTAMQNPDGFTLNINNGELITSGYAVAYKETQNSFGMDGLRNAIKHANEHDAIIGGWLNTDNNQYYYDSIKIIENESDAIEFGKEQEQIAIFNLDTLTEIKL